MEISKKTLEDANHLMDVLGEKNQEFMGLTVREGAIFDTLLWLIGGGEKPE